jgi:hypothetical protein
MTTAATATELRFLNLRNLYWAAAPFLGGDTALHAALRLHFSTPAGPEDLCLYRLLDALRDPAKPYDAEDVAEDYQIVQTIGVWLAMGEPRPDPFRHEDA